MATVVNGARIDFGGYEYGIEAPDGTVVKCLSFEVMHRIAADYQVPMHFRAVYVTEWWEATEPNNEEAENNEA